MSKITLRDVTKKIGSGATPRGGGSTYLEHGEYALIRSQNITDSGFNFSGLAYISEEQAQKLSNVKVESNDVLVNITGDSVARVSRPDNAALPAVVNQHVAIIRPDLTKISTEYLYYFLKSREQNNKLLAISLGGATRKALTKGQLESFEIFVPEKHQEIGDSLALIDEKIELNRKMNETLEEMGQALFNEWYGKYSPDQPDNLPKGWTLCALKDLTETISKGTTPRKIEVEGKQGVVPFIKVKDISDEYSILLDNLELIPEDVHSHSLKRSVLSDSDILFSIAGTIGRVAEITPILDGANCNQAIAFIRLKDRSLHFEMVYTLMKSVAFQNKIKSSIVQGVQANVSLGVLGGSKILLPDEKSLRHISNVIKPLLHEIRVNSGEINNLTEMRDSLLPRLIDGRIEL